MFDKVKNLSNSKKAGLVLLTFLLFSTLLIPKMASAGIGEAIVNALLGMLNSIFFAILSLILYMLISLTNIGVVISAGLFNWIINADIPLTRCAVAHSGACVIDIGWDFTRDLANMFFILAMVVIAFATILGQETYGMRRTLPLLIIIALLVNFSQLIVGAIVDVSQVLINFFTSEVGGFVKTLKTSFTWFTNWALGIFKPGITINFMAQIGSLAQGLAILVFNIIATIVFSLLFAIFFLRIPMLWLLTILAPIAFVTYIFPFTKNLPLPGFNKWLDQVLKWAFIGFFALFFVYLAHLLLGSLVGETLRLPTVSAAEDFWNEDFGLSSLLNELFPYAVVILFLIMGLLASFQINAMFAGGTIKGIRGAEKWARTKTWGVAKGYAKPRVEEAARVPEAAGTVGRGLARIPIVGGVLSKPFLERAKAPQEAVEKGKTEIGKYENMPDLQVAKWRGETHGAARVGMFVGMAKNLASKDIEPASQGITPDDINNMRALAERYNRAGEINKLFPAYIPDPAEREDFIRTRLKPGDIQYCHLSTFVDRVSQNALLDRGPVYLRNVAEHHPRGRDEMRDMIASAYGNGNYAAGVRDPTFQAQFPAAATYLQTPSAVRDGWPTV
jgi:hypothetical protein